MTNLTEQWEKGELPSGWYYVKVIPDFEYPDDIAFYTGGHFELYSDEDIEQVLVPLPSYEQWQQLKELLKECRSPINYALCCNLSEEEKIEFKNLLAKIKQVLGEE